MKTLSASELRVLMEHQQGPCISLFLPTHRAGGDTQQDPLRLRHQLRAVENRLLLKDLRSTQVQALLSISSRCCHSRPMMGVSLSCLSRKKRYGCLRAHTTPSTKSHYL